MQARGTRALGRSTNAPESELKLTNEYSFALTRRTAAHFFLAVYFHAGLFVASSAKWSGLEQKLYSVE